MKIKNAACLDGPPRSKKIRAATSQHRRPCKDSTLEADAALQFQHAALQTIDCRAEQRIRHWRDGGALRRTAIKVTDHRRGAAERKRRQVQLVDRVVGSHSKLNLRSFSKKLHRRRPEFLGDGEIDILIPRTAETIAPDSREIWRCARCLQREVRIGAVGSDPSQGWKIAGSGRQERRGVQIFPRTSVVPDRPKRAQSRRADYRTDIVCYRRPREARVKLINSVQLPASDNLAQNILAAAEYRQIPDCECPEIVGGVVV